MPSSPESPTRSAPIGTPTVSEWVAALRAPLMGLVACWTSDWREAEEVAQDTLAEAWMARERFRGDWTDPKAVGPWVRGIAFRLHAARQRKRGRLQRVSDDDFELDKPEQDGDPRMEAMRRAFENLDADAQEILRLRYLDRTTSKRVAELLGVTPKAVERRLARARAELKKKTERLLRAEANR